MGGVLTNLMLAIVIVTSADPEGTRVDDTPMTIMIPLVLLFIIDKNYSFIRPLEFMFKSSKDDVTAFTSDIVKLLKVRCNSITPCYYSFAAIVTDYEALVPP